MSPVWFLLTLLPVLGGAARFNCKGRILGAYYADAKSGCKAFHVCVRVAGGGIRDFRFFCPPGTLFHQEAQTCTDWGDDDPLACPADIYDGFETKKLSSHGNRDEEAEFGLQRAETGDLRLSQNNVTPNRPETDLRAAHSSDFFSGQRDRGRDESVSASQPSSPVPSTTSSQPQLYPRQSFRRSTTERTFPTSQNTSPTTPSTAPPQPPKRSQYDVGSKRKIIRKRPIYVSKSTTTTLSPNIIPKENYPQQIKQTQQNYTPQQNFNTQQNLNQNFNNQQYINRRGPSQGRQFSTSTPDVPPQYREYKDEYVEVSRVTPKQNRYFPSSTFSTTISQTTTAQKNNNKKEGLIELFNYDAQATPDLQAQNENQPLNVRNNFNTADVARNPESTRINNFNFNNARESPTTINYSVTTRGFLTSTPGYKNFNSVSYESEKNNFVPYSKQTNTNNYSTFAAPITTIYTTFRPEPPPNLNTVAYNTNIGFNAQANNYADGDEDDGQYHPPEGEDDGQYKPEVYDRELLTGAHSINIAASGNRLSEDRKTHSKTNSASKKTGKTAAPRPFRPAPTTIQPTTGVPDTTTFQPLTVSTQRTFDYYQTYTTTSRPTDFLVEGQTYGPTNDVPRPTTTAASKIPETRPPRPSSRAPVVPTQPQTAPPRPSTRPPNFARPVNKKEDNSYDYAYYDSDPGFVEYDHIEEFGKTNKKRS